MSKNDEDKESRTRDSSPVLRAATLALCCVLFPALAARAQSGPAAKGAPVQPPPAAKPAQPNSDDKATAAQKYFTDVELINQSGETVRLYSDLLKNKVVVINAFFATCQGSCLPMNRNLERVQETFRARLGKDLHIISITVDPETDTPASLREYAKRLNAAPGRHFVTGKKENLDLALRKLGQYVEQREQHTNIFIVGNERTGLWKKVFGLAKPEEIIKIVESVLNDSAPPAAAK